MHPIHRSGTQLRIEDAFLRGRRYPVVVWWYGPVEKNTKDRTVPLVLVLFRRLDEAGKPTTWLSRRMPLTYLGLLRIGSVWREGACEGRVDWPSETFDVDFSDQGWSCISPDDAIKRGLPNPIPADEYPLQFLRDRNYLLDFNLAGGKNLLVPCMEFFARCYGRSAEVKRVLATYPWPEAERRLYRPFDEQTPPGAWAVKLAKRMCNDDVVFLAHVKYDAYARRVAKSIYSQIEAASTYDSRKKLQVFLKAIPWFSGPARFKVAGIQFNGGQSFLGLRILGASQPHGIAVIRDREDRSDLAGGEESGSSQGSGSKLSIMGARSGLDILDLTSDEEPDHGSISVGIEEDDFTLLGEPRTVIDRKTAIERGLVRRTSGGGTKSFSTGESHGTGKGVGYGSIHAPVVLESQGALREMWKAARHVGEAYSQIVRSVGWFTFDGGISYDKEPKLIALTPDHDGARKAKSTWAYYNVAAKVPRGVLVIAMEVGGMVVYMLEIQRRATRHRDGTESEELFKGLAVTVQREQDPRQWLHRILHGIQEKKGVVQKLVDKCPGTAYAYKHVASARVTGVPYEASVLNALAKVGLTIGATPRQRGASRGVSRRTASECPYRPGVV